MRKIATRCNEPSKERARRGTRKVEEISCCKRGAVDDGAGNLISTHATTEQVSKQASIIQLYAGRDKQHRTTNIERKKTSSNNGNGWLLTCFVDRSIDRVSEGQTD